MNHSEIFKSHPLKSLYDDLVDLNSTLDKEFNSQFDRSIPFFEELANRWERAKKLGFGENSSIYDSAFVFGNPKVGNDVWIGPYTIIDSTGGLIIGNNVTISAGVHIYTHDNLKQTLLGKKFSIEHGEVFIGNNTYIAPNVVISKNNSIGSHCIIATNSFVNNSFPNNSVIAGNPAKKIGEIIINEDDYELIYFK
tara:strand:- start:598 stop:1182 length:585 start_codon:yes stop_codon:yes gene_type:complete